MRKKALDVKRRLLLMKPVPQPIQSLGDLVEERVALEGVLGRFLFQYTGEQIYGWPIIGKFSRRKIFQRWYSGRFHCRASWTEKIVF